MNLAARHRQARVGQERQLVGKLHEGDDPTGKAAEPRERGGFTAVGPGANARVGSNLPAALLNDRSPRRVAVRLKVRASPRESPRRRRGGCRRSRLQ